MFFPIFIQTQHDDYHHETYKPKYKYKEKLETSDFFKTVILVFKLKESVKPKTFWQKFWWIPKHETIRLGYDHITKYEIEKIHDDITAKQYIKENEFIRYIDGDYSFVNKLFEYAEEDMIQDILENYEFVEKKDLGFTTEWVRVNPNEREVCE